MLSWLNILVYSLSKIEKREEDFFFMNGFYNLPSCKNPWPAFLFPLKTQPNFYQNAWTPF